MNGDDLGKLIADAVIGAIPVGTTIPDQVKTDIQNQWKIVANTIVTYITTNARVSVTASGTATLTAQVAPPNYSGTATGNITTSTTEGTIS